MSKAAAGNKQLNNLFIWEGVLILGALLYNKEIKEVGRWGVGQTDCPEIHIPGARLQEVATNSENLSSIS